MKAFIVVICLLFSAAASRAQTTLMTGNEAHYSEVEAQQAIDSIYSRLLAGESFEKLAIRLSQDPGSFAKGGSLGWQKPGIYVSEFRDVVNTLPINQYSKPFKTTFGYHIVQVLDKKGGAALVRHILLRV